MLEAAVEMVRSTLEASPSYQARFADPDPDLLDRAGRALVERGLPGRRRWVREILPAALETYLTTVSAAK